VLKDNPVAILAAIRRVLQGGVYIDHKLRDSMTDKPSARGSSDKQ
jgi:DNA-binding NarL/FixJ family response regulator